MGLRDSNPFPLEDRAQKLAFKLVKMASTGLKALYGPIINVMDRRIMFGCRILMLFFRSSKVRGLGQYE